MPRACSSEQLFQKRLFDIKKNLHYRQTVYGFLCSRFFSNQENFSECELSDAPIALLRINLRSSHLFFALFLSWHGGKYQMGAEKILLIIRKPAYWAPLLFVNDGFCVYRSFYSASFVFPSPLHFTLEKKYHPYRRLSFSNHLLYLKLFR